MSVSATQFTVPTVAEAVAAAIGERELIIQGERRYTYAETVERSNRLAAYLHSRGLGCHTERSALSGRTSSAYTPTTETNSSRRYWVPSPRESPRSTSTSATSKLSCSISSRIRVRPR
jgi:non-ribosomal peptide synthetase component F